MDSARIRAGRIETIKNKTETDNSNLQMRRYLRVNISYHPSELPWRKELRAHQLIAKGLSLLGVTKH